MRIVGEIKEQTLPRPARPPWSNPLKHRRANPRKSPSPKTPNTPPKEAKTPKYTPKGSPNHHTQTHLNPPNQAAPKPLVSEAPLRNLRASGPFTQHTAQSGHAPQFSHSAVLQHSESRALGLEPNSTQLPQLVSTNSELGLQLSKHKNWLLMPLRHPAVALVKASWLETLHKHSKRPQSSH